MSEGNSSCYVTGINTNISCEKFHHIVYDVKLGTSSISCLANLVAVLVIIIGGSYTRLAVRSVLYFLIANSLLVVAKILQVLPVNYNTKDDHVEVSVEWQGICSYVAFLAQVTVWMRNFVFIFIVIQISVMIRNPANYWQEQSQKPKTHEIVSICVCFLLPFTFNWIPFVDNYYGLSGHWCWIRLLNETAQFEDEGLVFMAVLYFGPLSIIVLLTSLFCFYVLCNWCWSPYKHKEIVMAILYPIFFDAVYVIMTYNRIDSALRTKNQDPPKLYHWVLHTVADSGVTTLPPLFVMLLLICPTSRKILIPRFTLKEEANNNEVDETTNIINK